MPDCAKTCLQPPYAISSDEVVEALQSSAIDGLSGTEAERRLGIYGANEIQRRERYSRWKVFWRQLRDPQMFLLFGAAALSFCIAVLRHQGGFSVEPLVIAGIALFNALLGLIQEDRAQRAMEALRQMAPLIATVTRDGEAQSIPAKRLVPGDIISVEEGNLVPADARVVASSSLRVTEALLTGESASIRKGPTPVPEKTAVMDRTSMLFAGTAVLSGSGKAVVVATGGDSELGHVSSMLIDIQQNPTPLQKQLAVLSKKVAVAVAVIAIVISALLLGFQRSWSLGAASEIVLFSLSLAVAASPEALGTIVTLTLAAGVHRLAGRGAIVRRMTAVETLGATTVILADKTGTLTQNKLAVQEVVDSSQLFDRPGARKNGGTELLLRAAVLANTATVKSENGYLQLNGDPLDRALWEHALTRGISLEEIRTEYTFLQTAPFTSERKRMSAVVRTNDGSIFLFAKGAPETILNLCRACLIDNRPEPLSGDAVSKVSADAAKLAAQGMKVIAMAFRRLPGYGDDAAGCAEDDERELIFVGLISLSDPIREGTSATIQEAARAEIRTIVLSGDHPLATANIARAASIPNPDRVLTGAEIDDATDEELADLMRIYNVLARVTPGHKLRVVRSLQQRGGVVAMTGDGVNDAPALKQADVGIAMGGGTDLAKQVSDVILTDDNISTILHAITEGRLITHNIGRATTYLLSANLCEVLSLVVAIVFGLIYPQNGVGSISLPLSAPQLLWVNLVTDSVPALALAFLPVNAVIMRGRPRNSSDEIFGRKHVLRIAAYSGMMTAMVVTTYLAYLHELPTYRQTATVTTLIWAQALYALTLQSPAQGASQYIKQGRRLFIAITAVIALHFCVVQFSFGAKVLGLAALRAATWAICASLSLPVLVLGELLKLKRVKRTKRRPDLRCA